MIGVLSHRQNCGNWNFGSPLVIKDQPMNGTNSSAVVLDMKMMNVNVSDGGAEVKGRQLHSLMQSDPVMGTTSDHYYDPLPVFTKIDHHLDWIIENTKDSCYCKPRFQFNIRFN